MGGLQAFAGTTRSIVHARTNRAVSLSSSPLIPPHMHLPTKRRLHISQPRTSSAPPSPASPVPPKDPRTDRSRHRNFYRDILPPFLRVLAYSTAVYFSLQLTWIYLDSREQGFLEEQEKERLIGLVREKREQAAIGRGILNKQENEKRSWWDWIRTAKGG